MVTRIRNLNERGFGRLTSTWGILRRVLDADLVRLFRPLYRLLLAVDNAYFAPLWNESEYDDSDLELFRRAASSAKNTVFDLVSSTLSSKKKPQWKRIGEAALIGRCPGDLNMVNLRKFNGGPYAIRLAPRYLDFQEPSIVFMESRELTGILKVTGLKSRFSKNPKARTQYIQLGVYTKSTVIYCNCKCGTRTIGSCAHGIAVLYYLISLVRPQEIPSRSESNSFAEVIDLHDFAVETRKRNRSESFISRKTDMVSKILEENDDEGSSEDEGDSGGDDPMDLEDDSV